MRPLCDPRARIASRRDSDGGGAICAIAWEHKIRETKMRATQPIEHKTALAALIAASVLAAAVAPRLAAAEGALAVGEPADVAAEGYAYGFAVNRPSLDVASAAAMGDCTRPTPGIDPRAQALCKVVQTFRNRCFAVAMDPKDATPGVGWAIADDKDTAGRNAIVKCQATAGDDRRDFCKVTHSDCDGSAK
jgi:hypothetical protein